MNSNNQGGFVGVVVIGLVVTIIVGAIGFGFYRSWGTHRTETVTVNKSERITSTCGESVCSKYLVYTAQGVYENTDDLLNWKFNSSDLYNQLQEGNAYSCDVVGWRNGLFSWYPNLISCEDETKS